MNPVVLVVDDEPDVEVLFLGSSGVISALAALQWSLPNCPIWCSKRIADAGRGIADLNPFRHQHAGDERPRTACLRPKHCDRTFLSL